MLTLASAFAYRWRGAGHLALGRILCAGLIASPLLLGSWLLLLPVALLSWAAICLDHDPSGRDLEQNTQSGVLFTGYAALAWLALGQWIPALALAAAGLLKGPLYRFIPAGSEPDRKFLYRELAFGACWGLACDLVVLVNL